MTKSRLAELSGLTRETVYRLERAVCTPRDDTVRRLARALSIDPKMLRATVADEAYDAWDGSRVTGPGEALREIRRSRKWSLERAARAAGVSATYLSRLERAIERPKPPLFETTERWDDNLRAIRIASAPLAFVLGYSSAEALSAACGLPIRPRQFMISLLPSERPEEDDWYALNWPKS